MATNDSSNPDGRCPLDLVEILKRLGAHRRAMHKQIFGNPPWTHEQSDAYWHHPLVRACKWLEERVGISRHDLEHAAFRLTTPHGLKGMGAFPNPDGSEGDPEIPDWLWMTGKFRELDRDGTTARLWRWLADEYPVILEEAGIPDEPTGNARTTTQAKQADDATPRTGQSEGTGNTPPAPGDAKATDAETNRDKFDKLPKARRLAYFAFQYACEKTGTHPDKLLDWQALDWLKKNPIDLPDELAGELANYRPPESLATWVKYLGDARAALGEQKHRRGTPAPTGHSVVRRDEL